MIKVQRTSSNFEREPLASPFGFKGGYISELWQSIALIESDSGNTSLGLGTQSTLWSDASVFAGNSESGGNSIMYLMTAFALKLIAGRSFDTPFSLLDEILPEVHGYGKSISNSPSLRLTFALNSLVAVDNAAWMLYCAEKNITSFDDMIPEDIKSALCYRHDKLACIPLMSYGVPVQDIERNLNAGYFFLKIKMGSDPDGDGDLDKMLEWDKARLSAIHEAAKDCEIEYTHNHQVPYYLDANGRYESKDRLMRLLEHARKIGALERIVLLEEPFPEELQIDVRDIPVRFAADESAHSDKDALERIQMGYTAIALKPIAKTMSMSLKIAQLAHEHSVPCFCADLTVNPILVDWNKNVAARLAPLPGMEIGVIESNGHQNYLCWDRMKNHHPCAGSNWIEPRNGIYYIGDDFYTCSAGIFKVSDYYRDLAVIR